MELLHLLNVWLALVALHLFQGLVELERQSHHSEQGAGLPRQHNAPDTQLALPYSVQEVRVRRCDQAVVLAVHHLQAIALADKYIPAQHGLEIVLALLCSVLHSGHQNDEPLW